MVPIQQSMGREQFVEIALEVLLKNRDDLGLKGLNGNSSRFKEKIRKSVSFDYFKDRGILVGEGRDFFVTVYDMSHRVTAEEFCRAPMTTQTHDGGEDVSLIWKYKSPDEKMNVACVVSKPALYQ